MTDKFIIVSAEFKRLFDKVLNPPMTTLKEALVLALERKNKQAHRIVSGTKRARQHLASTKNQQDIHTETNARDSANGSTIKGTISKRDI